MAKKIIPGINLKAERELTVEITKEDIENEIENVAKIYRKRAKIKGFRPGRAPLELVKATFKDEILEDARSEALKKKIWNELEARKEEPVSEIKIVDIKEEDDKLIAVFSYEAIPTFLFPNLTEIKVEKKIKRVSDIDVEEEVDKMRKRLAKYIPIQREAEEGDYIIADYEERINGKTVKRNKNILVHLSWGEMKPEVFEKFKGTRKGDTVTFADFIETENGERAKIEFIYRIKEVAEEKLPEIDDEFAKRLGFENVNEMYEKIRQNLEEKYERESEDKLEWQIIDEIYNRIQFELPQSMVENKLEFLKRSMGVKEFPEHMKDSMENLARDLVKREIILMRFAESEGLIPTEEEIEKEIEKRAQEYHMDKEKYRKELEKRRTLENIVEYLKIEKAMETLKNLVKLEVIFE